MNPAFLITEQILEFLWTNRDKVKAIVLGLEGLAEGALGVDKAAAFKSHIGAVLGVEAQIEAAWPMVAPFFNLAVKSIKAKAATTASA